MRPAFRLPLLARDPLTSPTLIHLPPPSPHGSPAFASSPSSSSLTPASYSSNQASPPAMTASPPLFALSARQRSISLQDEPFDDDKDSWKAVERGVLKLVALDEHLEDENVGSLSDSRVIDNLVEQFSHLSSNQQNTSSTSSLIGDLRSPPPPSDWQTNCNFSSNDLSCLFYNAEASTILKSSPSKSGFNHQVSPPETPFSCWNGDHASASSLSLTSNNSEKSRYTDLFQNRPPIFSTDACPKDDFYDLKQDLLGLLDGGSNCRPPPPLYRHLETLDSDLLDHRFNNIGRNHQLLKSSTSLAALNANASPFQPCPSPSSNGSKFGVFGLDPPSNSSLLSHFSKSSQFGHLSSNEYGYLFGAASGSSAAAAASGGVSSGISNGVACKTPSTIGGNGNLFEALVQDKPSRYLIVGNIPAHIPYQSLRLFEDGNVIRAVYAGALRTHRILIAAFFDIRYARLTMKDLEQRTVEGSALKIRFCSPQKLALVIKDSEPGFITPNDGTIECTNLANHCNITELQMLVASLGHIRSSSPNYDSINNKYILTVEYFDIRDAAKACDQLNGNVFQGSMMNVYLKTSSSEMILGYSKLNSNNVQYVGTARPRITRSQTVPSIPSISNVESIMSVGAEKEESINKMREAIYIRREQQRLIEADRTALLKHQVPSGNEINLWRIIQGTDTRTTCMIRNIPNKYTQQMLLDTVNSTHYGEFDFFYLRMDFRNHCNVGYAFINFIDVKSVVSFAQKHVGRKWNKFGSDKVCRLSYANIQGRQALIDKFRNSAVMEKDPSYRPKLFYSNGTLRGQEETFPGPTHGGRRGSRDPEREEDAEHWAGAKTAMTALGLMEAEEELEWIEMNGTFDS